MWALNVGAFATNPDTKDFSRKVLWNLKSFHQNKIVQSVRKFCGFLRGFFKSPLKRRFGTQFQHIMPKIKKRGNAAFFRVSVKCWGVAPNPDAKDFS